MSRTYCNGKVKGGDNTDDAQRIRHFTHEMLVPLTRQDNTANLPRKAQRDIGDIQKLDDLAAALGLDLAHLERNQHSEIIDVFGEGRADIAKDVATLRGRHFAELALSGFGGGDGEFDVLR